MICDEKFLYSGIFLLFISSTSLASNAYYDTIYNVTHTCNIAPMVVCVDVVVVNTSCVDPLCLVYSRGNYSSCILPLMTSNVPTGNSNGTVGNLNNTTGNITVGNSTANTTTVQTCNATWIYPSNTSFCFNASSWNKTVCSQKNVTCKINSTQCTLNAVVYIGGFFNLRSKDGFGNLPAAKLAVNQINKDNTTLQNITLSLVAKQSTQSLLSYGTQILYNYLYSGPTKLMLLLPQEADLARTVAAYAGLKRWGTLQFSYGTTDNSLAWNKQLFPRFYRLNPLAITYNRLRAEFVASFPDWKLDVGLLYYADPYHQEVNDDLNKRLKAKGINVVANVGFKSNPAEAVYMLKEKNAHVILTSFPYWYGKKMFCKAFQLGMYGPHYVWITFILLPYKFWVPKPTDSLECTEDEMTCIAENHFSFYGATLYNANSPVINEPNVTFSQTYNDLVNSTKNRTNAAPYVYDAIWTMTNILERARPVLTKKGKVLNELSYSEETEILERLANETDFKGVTGRIRFYENGNRKFTMSVLQVRKNGVGYFVGKYDEDKDHYEDSNDILWQGLKVSDGGWPYRRTTETYKWRYIVLALFIAWCILASLGMFYAIFCLVFVIIYRRERSIKYSSPTINVVIILGCLINFIAVVLYGVDYQRASESRMTALCKVRLWIFSVGFTFCIGGLWVKVWTLYQILIERKVYRKQKMEYWMFAIVMVLLVIDIIYLTTWTIVDGLYRSFEIVTDQPTYKCFQKLSGNPFVATIWYIEICDCDNLALWSAIFLTYKTLVLLFGAYMAWKVRMVYTRKLVDAQYCAILLILAVPFCFLGLVFAFTLRLYPTPHYALLGIIIIIYTYIVLAFLYGHKIKNIFCTPRNIIKVRGKDDTGRMKCCSAIFCGCCAPIAGCMAGCFYIISACFAPLARYCCVCCPQNCGKGLCGALVNGPKKNRGSFVHENEKMDYLIGDMPGDRERQIIILQKQVEKREEELKRLRLNHRATLAVKQTQTMDYFYTNGGDGTNGTAGLGRSNEGFSDNEEKNNDRQRTGRPQYNRFKVYHRKLDFSHVGSKVDSGLDGRFSTKRNSLPISEDCSHDLRRGSNDSEILLLQKTLSERDKELARLKAYLGMDPSSSTELSSKAGSLANIGEEKNSQTPPEGEVPNRSLNSVAITIQSSDSERDSKQTGSDMSSDRVPSDVNNEEQTEEILGETNNTAVDQEAQHGIFPDTQPVENESEARESSDEKNKEEGEKKERNKPKILASAYGGSMTYISHYNAKTSAGKFKTKVRQLNAFGVFARKSGSDDDAPNVQNDKNNSSAVNLLKTSSDSLANVRSGLGVTPNVREKSTVGVDEENSASEGNNVSSGKVGNGQKSRNNVKVFNEPTNWSHVNSRLFDANANEQNALKPSTNTTQTSKVGIEDDSEKTGQNPSETDENEKKKSGVKIFNSPSDYSHVKSRLFNPSQPENLLKPSPNTRRRSKVGIEDDDGVSTSGDGDGGKKRNGVKIFTEFSDYSHVKSRLFDSNASGNQLNSENFLKPSPTVRRKSKVGIEDDGDINNDELSKRRGNVKIFNAPSDYSHVKSRLFENGPPSRPSSQINPQEVDDAVNKQGNESGQEKEKEKQISKSRSNVKIFNAPSDYSHVRSRLYDASNKNTANKFKRKVKQINAFGPMKTKSTNLNEQNEKINKEESTSL